MMAAKNGKMIEMCWLLGAWPEQNYSVGQRGYHNQILRYISVSKKIVLYVHMWAFFGTFKLFFAFTNWIA